MSGEQTALDWKGKRGGGGRDLERRGVSKRGREEGKGEEEKERKVKEGGRKSEGEQRGRRGRRCRTGGGRG